MASLFSTILLSACSVVGIRSGTEEPHYAVVDRIGTIEVRHYDPRVAAETTVQAGEVEARSIGFRRLAGYIFGGNTTKASIAMTAPVAQSGGGGGEPTAQAARGGERIDMTAPVAQSQVVPASIADGKPVPASWVIRFFLPATVSLANAPAPNDTQVRVVAVPAETVAVLQYSGTPNPGAEQAAQARLVRSIGSSHWKQAGPPFSWFYDPPWTLPFLRRNEAVVPVVPIAP